MVKAKTTKAIKKQTEQIKTGKPTYYYAVGRRKTAAARARLYILATETEVTLGDKKYTKGQIIVNDKPIENYFSGEVAKKAYIEPLRTTNNLNRFVITVRVEGGGLQGQLEAVIHAISRALVKIDNEKYRPILKKRKFLTRDPRAKQRRKAGFAGKARKRKQSPKR
ncbi:MAG: 30S ribosomal protein S9 [Candidatus Gottesmanbacteria bacterium GW2011_GWA1_34_13]|uniref:30S ribosomal protein S9 n=1 Tax=Candidatus Gottesmanbacteria bacterium GW2011_GWA1_34_13 TaxID=1618434 RepID=A0A0G0ASG9_9BACT|nr:MAG: 30S ribosomal protein S9 [Candidatus Gottesmanbacteria bacterium GW2011_GWA1_34_13]